MIEVLEHGNTYRKIECEYCQCVFRFTDEDTLWLSMSRSMIKCPECGRLLDKQDALKVGENE